MFIFTGRQHLKPLPLPLPLPLRSVLGEVFVLYNPLFRTQIKDRVWKRSRPTNSARASCKLSFQRLWNFLIPYRREVISIDQCTFTKYIVSFLTFNFSPTFYFTYAVG